MANRSYRHRRKMLLYYVTALFVLSIAFVLMPFATRLRDHTVALISISGLLLWAGLIGSVVTAIQINRSRRQDAVFQEVFPNAKRCGLTHFFQNQQAVKADIVFFASLLALIVCSIWGNQIAVFVCIAFTVFSSGMHWMLNSINYVYINYRSRRDE